MSTGSPESAYQTGTPATTPSSSCLFRSRARLIHRRDLTQAVRHVRRFRHHRRGPRPVRCTVQGAARRVTGDRFASPQSFSVNRVRHITTSVWYAALQRGRIHTDVKYHCGKPRHTTRLEPDQRLNNFALVHGLISVLNMVEVIFGGEHAARVNLAFKHRIQQTTVNIVVAHGAGPPLMPMLP